ncbi:MAG: hypothetical protein ACKO0M_14595 [Cyanobium sp.]
MTPSAMAQSSEIQPPALGGDAINFTPIPCLLTVEELDEKRDEQFTIIWNGINTPT